MPIAAPSSRDASLRADATPCLAAGSASTIPWVAGPWPRPPPAPISAKPAKTAGGLSRLPASAVSTAPAAMITSPADDRHACARAVGEPQPDGHERDERDDVRQQPERALQRPPAEDERVVLKRQEEPAERGAEHRQDRDRRRREHAVGEQAHVEHRRRAPQLVDDEPGARRQRGRRGGQHERVADRRARAAR